MVQVAYLFYTNNKIWINLLYYKDGLFEYSSEALCDDGVEGDDLEEAE